MTQHSKVLESLLRWKEYRVADLISPLPNPRLIEHTAVVLEEIKNENESVLYGLKYFENPKEAEIFYQVMLSFLEELLLDSNLTLSIKNKEESFYPNKLSLDCCEDKAKIRTIRITHQYSTLINFNGVRTSMSIEDLNYACIYLQLLYDTLPDFSTVQDVLVEDCCVMLLSRFYDCKPIISNYHPIDFDEEDDDSEIDLYFNWEEYAWLGKNLTILNKRFARPEVKLAMLEVMLQEAIASVERNSTPEREKVIERLMAIKNGQAVPIEWGLKRLDYM